MFKDISLTAIIAGFVAVLVGFTSSAVIVFHAAESAGATTAEVSSWLGALGIGMGVTTIGLSLYYRMPVLTAWSTPGAALHQVSPKVSTIHLIPATTRLSRPRRPPW